MSRAILPVIAVAAALTITGCTGDDHADPRPTTTTATTTNEPETTTSPPTTSTTTPRPTVAPPVTEPVDLRSLYDHPCAVLTPAQRRQIGFRTFDPVEPEGVNSKFSTCIWKKEPKAGTDDGYGYTLTLFVSGDPLARAYAESNKHDEYKQFDWATFEPRQLDGLPAVVRSLVSPDDECGVVVGTGHGHGIEISGVVAHKDRTLCDRMVAAAEWVVDAARR